MAGTVSTQIRYMFNSELSFGMIRNLPLLLFVFHDPTFSDAALGKDAQIVCSGPRPAPLFCAFCLQHLGSQPSPS